jgi:FemAB-related protein (PEP-CTERM system-associated)
MEEKDSSKWQEYIAAHPDHSPYHSYAWGQAIYNAYNHPLFYLMAFQKEQVVGVLPIIKIRPLFLKSKFCALPFCDVGNCLSDNVDVKQTLLDYAYESLGVNSDNPLELRESGKEISTIVDSKSNLDGQKVRMLLQLPASSDELFASFKSKLRSQIRKAEKNGLNVEVGSSQQLIDEFYEVFAHNMRSLGSPVHGKNIFLELQKNYGKKLLVSIVRKDKIAIGAGIVLLGGDMASIPWASTRAEYNKLAPNMMLYWSLLQHVTDLGCKTFDFGRSTYAEGTFKFKQQWGAKPFALKWLTYRENQQHTLENTTDSSGRGRAIAEHIWRKLPLSLTIFIGPKIRKFISL